MDDFYSDMAQAAAELLSPTSEGGLGQGVVQIVRVIPGEPDPATPWIPGEPTTQTVTLKAAVSRVATKYVDGSLIVATDDQCIFADPGFAPSMSDQFIVDGRQRVVKSIKPIPGAGIVAAYIAFLAA